MKVEQEYVFDNAGKTALARHRGLSGLYDANTIRHIERRGIDKGWSCLEVGGLSTQARNNFRSLCIME